MEITKENLQKLYVEQKLPNKELLKIFNVKSLTTLKKHIRNFHLPARPKPFHKIYYANNDFFSCWSHDMAYCLGFITADGHVWKERPYLTIAISKRDQQVLIFLRDCISPTSKVRDNYNHNMVQLCIHSPQIWHDLKQYNVTHGKTWNLRIDFDIPQEFWSDYLRGFFDGDGCIYFCNIRGRRYYYSSFSCASQQMLIDIQQRLQMGHIRCLRGKYYELKLCQSDTILLGQIIYQNKDAFKLERKYEKFFQIQQGYQFWTPKEDAIIIEHLDFNNTRQLFCLLPDRSPKSVQARKNKLRKERKYKAPIF